MTLRIHICRDTADAKGIIQTEKLVLNDPNLDAKILTEPDIVIFDYSKNRNNPSQVNENKVCVVFDD
jgi:hypothetical protein